MEASLKCPYCGEWYNRYDIDEALEEEEVEGVESICKSCERRKISYSIEKE